MANVTLAPYLFFAGNAREAMEFYKGIFGGELTIQTMDEIPQDSPDRKMVTEENKTNVMHARLSGDFTLMASDSQQASDKTAKIELSLMGADEPTLRKMFDELSSGGKVKMPLTKMSWGDLWGNLTDKYGVDWMVNIGTSMS